MNASLALDGVIFKLQLYILAAPPLVIQTRLCAAVQ
ncbi:hypothetical protein AF72_05400 [Xylella taiwanensis]|uniref:Uncharacterized protein n=1 Tax=Xylella taiwanensis TaxID=1444770 RepID=Z9JJA9_9GAMM|nr:hypothetical protein AF72_05400 [Xylella taiwanensis]